MASSRPIALFLLLASTALNITQYAIVEAFSLSPNNGPISNDATSRRIRVRAVGGTLHHHRRHDSSSSLAHKRRLLLSHQTRPDTTTATSTTLHQSSSSTTVDTTSAIITTDNNNNNYNPFLARRERIIYEIKTFLRVLLPACLSGILAFLSLPAICNNVANFVLHRDALKNYAAAAPAIGAIDQIGNFISLIGLLYSILVGQVFGFLYSQQEVSEKKKRKKVFLWWEI